MVHVYVMHVCIRTFDGLASQLQPLRLALDSGVLHIKPGLSLECRDVMS